MFTLTFKPYRKKIKHMELVKSKQGIGKLFNYDIMAQKKIKPTSKPSQFYLASDLYILQFIALFNP